ncbi:MAG: peptidylprolyl isomerase [Parvibaculaceae bacterium]
MTSFLRDPLAHFAGMGLLLFLLFSAIGPDTPLEADTTIRVDRQALLTFIQYRTRSFDPAMAERRLAALDEEGLDRLVDEYVREEVLYREGLALGLDEDDYVIRRRLIQKVEFLAEGFAAAEGEVSDADLETYFEENKRDYYVSPTITFAHVFFDKNKHGAETERLAEEALARLNADEVPFSAAPGQGERFPFHVNYVERTPEFVASHFGAAMAEAVFGLPPDETAWKGVYTSPYGAHLVMVTSVQPGRVPELAEVRGRVREDALRLRVEKSMEEAVAEITGQYDVEIDLTGVRPE